MRAQLLTVVSVLLLSGQVACYPSYVRPECQTACPILRAKLGCDELTTTATPEVTTEEELTTTVAPEVTTEESGKCPYLFELIDGKCFTIAVANATFSESRDKCKDLALINEIPEENVDIGAIRNVVQNAGVVELAKDNGRFKVNDMWIGIHRDADRSVTPSKMQPWKYAKDKLPIVYENFGKGEPNNYKNDEYCIAMFLKDAKRRGTWFDNVCGVKKAAVLCEYTVPSTVDGSEF